LLYPVLLISVAFIGRNRSLRRMSGVLYISRHETNIIPTIKLALLCTALAGAFLVFTPSAHALTIGDGHELGFVNYGIPSGDSDRLTYVNHLIGMALWHYRAGIGPDLHAIRPRF
jgi:hypothetical protein